MSSEATLTSKGRTTIPKKIRNSLSMKAGGRMTFTLMPDGTIVMRVKSKSVTEVARVLNKKGRKPGFGRSQKPEPPPHSKCSLHRCRTRSAIPELRTRAAA